NVDRISAQISRAFGGNGGDAVSVVFREAVLAGNKLLVDELRDAKVVDRPELEQALNASGDAPVQLVLVPTEDVRRVLESLFPKLPEEAGGMPVTLFTRGIHWIS